MTFCSRFETPWLHFHNGMTPKFICQPIFKTFVALLKTVGMQKDDILRTARDF